MGKTSMIATLPDCVILDFEDGTDEHECLPIKVTTLNEYHEALVEIKKRNDVHLKATGKRFKYKYICIDTIDELEDAAVKYHTQLYNADIAANPKDRDGKTKVKLQTIYDLAYGAGYGYVREEVKTRIKQAAKLCEYLIITSHVKDKLLTEKTGVDVKDTEISLSGKLSTIVMAMASAIGYVFRSDTDIDLQGRPQLMVSFETVQDRASAGSRSAHLAGKTIKFNWDLVYID